MNKNGLRRRIAHDGQDFVDTRVIRVAHGIDRVSGSEKNRSPKLSLTFISAAIAPASSPRLPPFHELAVPGIVQVTTLKVDDRTHVQALPVTQIGRLRTAAAVGPLRNGELWCPPAPRGTVKLNVKTRQTSLTLHSRPRFSPGH
jgi:hypothetical protein